MAPIFIVDRVLAKTAVLLRALADTSENPTTRLPDVTTTLPAAASFTIPGLPSGTTTATPTLSGVARLAAGIIYAVDPAGKALADYLFPEVLWMMVILVMTMILHLLFIGQLPSTKKEKDLGTTADALPTAANEEGFAIDHAGSQEATGEGDSRKFVGKDGQAKPTGQVFVLVFSGLVLAHVVLLTSTHGSAWIWLLGAGNVRFVSRGAVAITMLLCLFLLAVPLGLVCWSARFLRKAFRRRHHAVPEGAADEEVRAKLTTGKVENEVKGRDAELDGAASTEGRQSGFARGGFWQRGLAC